MTLSAPLVQVRRVGAGTPVGYGHTWSAPVRTTLGLIPLGYGDGLPHLPADLEFRRLSRTGDRWRVAQEDMVRFTHDRELPWLLPGVAPTGRSVAVLAISVVVIRRSAVEERRTLWDLTTLLAQLGLQPALARQAVGPESP